MEYTFAMVKPDAADKTDDILKVRRAQRNRNWSTTRCDDAVAILSKS